MVDDRGEADGIGSRFFTIDNSASGTASRNNPGYEGSLQEDTSGVLSIGFKEMRKGFKLQVSEETGFNSDGILEVQVEEMEPWSVYFEGSSGERLFFGGAWEDGAGGEMPVGSTFDRERGIFSWMPAAGFIGKYLFRFFVADGYKKSRPLYVS